MPQEGCVVQSPVTVVGVVDETVYVMDGTAVPYVIADGDEAVIVTF